MNHKPFRCDPLVAVVAMAILWTAVWAVPLRAQEDRTVTPGLDGPAEAPSPLPGVFGEVLDVRVINLEVVVTDKKGTPILGLGAEDFSLTVDGVDVPIEYFSEIRGGVALEKRGAEAESLPGVPAVEPGQYVGTSYLVYIDDFFGIAPQRNAVLRSLRDDLGYLRPEDRMAIVAYDGKDLEMLSSWSSLQRPLERALDQAMRRPGKGLLRAVERKRFGVSSFAEFAALFGDAIGEPANLLDSQLDPEERAYVQLLTEQLNRSVAAASATLRSFARPPGRKVMILLSGGWPFVPADYLVGDASRILFDNAGPYGADLYRRLIETANLLGYTLYPVDMPGLEGGAQDLTTSELANPGDISSSAFLREREAHATLRYLARETGGQALVNARRIDALEHVAGDTRSYYWLGFAPTMERDDRRHAVEIGLNSPDLVARTRGGYLDLSRESEVSIAVESTLLFGNAAAAGSLDVEVGQAVEAGKRRMEVPIKVSIPLDDVTILPAAGQYGARLELRVAVLDANGQQAPIPIIPWQLTFTEMPPPGAVGTYETKLLLRRSLHEAVVAVHDPASGRIFSTGFEIVPVDR